MCVISIVFINQFTWIYFFDQDQYLKEYKKAFFFAVNFFQLLIGSSLIFFEFRPKLIFKVTAFAIYLIVIIEISSYLLIEYIFFSKKGLKEQIKHYTSDNESLFIPDLRSDYKPNSQHKDINAHGFRFGGKLRSKNSYRIMCIGGSTTWGDGAPDSIDTYPAQLEIYLQSKGFDVNVINAGVPYHTSLDALMRFITKGIYFKPDMLLINTGLNDNGPLQSPYNYKPDYSHWREVGFNEDRIFKNLWHDFPFSFPRLIFIYAFDFKLDNTMSHQTSSVAVEYLAKSKINRKKTVGLKNYFLSIIAIAKANNIIPVAIKANNDQSRAKSYVMKNINDENRNYAIERESKSTLLNNSIMDSISKVNNVKIIPFDKFQASSDEYWIDHCHLNKNGIREKAKFIGDFLIKEYSLQF